VYKVRRYSDNKYYALKKVKLEKLSFKEKENALNEVWILASIDNPYIVSYKDAFYEESMGSLCLIMELLEGGSLQEMIDDKKRRKDFIREEEAWRYMS
jgi:NIMA (never in mitosis gene a)-related kinase